MLARTNHAKQRMARRNLKPAEVDYVIQNGTQLHQAGALFYFLRDRDIPSSDHSNNGLERLAGTAVVLTRDGQLMITTWRNRSAGFKKIKRKVKYSLTADQLSQNPISGHEIRKSKELLP